MGFFIMLWANTTTTRTTKTTRKATETTQGTDLDYYATKGAEAEKVHDTAVQDHELVAMLHEVGDTFTQFNFSDE